MSAIMIFVVIVAAITILAGIGWWTYSLVRRCLPKREQQVAPRKLVHQPWDHKAGARGIR
jgi:hypothetical protein